MLTPPLRNDQGEVPYEIDDDDWVIRLVSKEWIVEDPKFPEGVRLTSKTWEDSSGDGEGMSVNLRSLIVADNKDPSTYLISEKLPASIKMRVGDVRQLGFTVGCDPILNDPVVANNPYHCQIWGSFTKSKRKSLKNISEWEVSYDGVSIGRDIDQKPI